MFGLCVLSVCLFCAVCVALLSGDQFVFNVALCVTMCCDCVVCCFGRLFCVCWLCGSLMINGIVMLLGLVCLSV